ncbi:MAG TPA: response regulator transcription factor [Opitutaceae bacterium]
MPASVFLVDDHPLVREGLEKLIAQQSDLIVCGQADSAATAYDEIVRLKPDVAVVDLSLGGASGLDLIKRLQALPEMPAVIVLSMHDDAVHAERSLRAGARGYVAKRESTKKVIEGIRLVLQGQLFISSAIASEVMAKMVGAASTPVSPVDKLSDREMEIFRRIGQGHETRRIAEELHISLKTVQTHCMHIKDKLSLASATQLMREAVRWVENELKL